MLARGGHAWLEAIPASDVEHALARQLSPGFDRFPERDEAVAGALGEGGGWRLTLSADPKDALPMLRRMLDEP